MGIMNIMIVMTVTTSEGTSLTRAIMWVQNYVFYFSSMSATTRSLTGLRWSRSTAPDQAGPRSQVSVDYAKEKEAQVGLHP